jgi:hypothetical protein
MRSDQCCSPSSPALATVEKPTEKIIEQASLTLAFLCYLFHPIPSQQGQPGSDMEK